MTALFDYPKSAAFGRMVPKSKLYEHAGADTALKALFVEQVDQIVWRYKLAPETINLSATPAMTEIQVFSIALKTGELDERVPRAIDSAIPFPLIFELAFEGKCKTMAAYKRPSEADSNKWVTSEYFETEWVPADAPRSALPVALDLGVLYEKILTAIMPADLHGGGPQVGENMPDRVARMEAIRAKAREVQRITARLAREKQFNKRVAINAELRAAKQELQRLGGATNPPEPE